MYAIVEIAGLQYKVQKDQQLYVHRIDAKEGDKVQFDNVMLIDDGGKVSVGAPVIDGAAVSAKIVKHLKGDKVIVFKKKRRKGYKKKNGHRQALTSLEIDKIITTGAKRVTPKKEAAPKKVAPKAAAPKVEAKKVAPKAAAPKVEAKKEAPKTVAPKVEAKKEAPKTVAPKVEAKKEAPKTAAPKAEPKKAAATKSSKDDLKKVEGIGPKIEETLNAAGINTFAELAKTSSEKISEIITDVRGKHVTDTWPKQAQMAHDGEWDALKKWQDELDGGKE